MDFDLNQLDKLSLDELEAVKNRASELIKMKKEAAKAAEKETKATIEADRVEKAKANLVKGAEIEFKMKGETRTAVVEKLTEKTATVTLPEGKRYIQFRFITKVTPPAVAEGPEAAEAVA